MSLFCPSAKSKKKGPQPIYNVIDTYKSSNPKNAKNKFKDPVILEIVEDFFPESALELPVRSGETVEFIKNEGAWVFVRADNGADGFIPRRNCRIWRNKNTLYKKGENSSIYGSLISISELSDMGYYSDAGFTRRKSMLDITQALNIDKQFKSNKNLKYRKDSFTQESSSSNSPASISSGDKDRRNYRSRKTSPVKPPRTKFSIQQNHINKPPVCGRRCLKGCKHGVDLHGNNKISEIGENRYENLLEVFDKEKQKFPEFHPINNVKKSSIVSVSSGLGTNEQFYLSSLSRTNSLKSENCVTNQDINNNEEKNRTVSMVSLENSIRDIVNDAEHVLKNEKTITNETKPNFVTKPCGHPELIVMKSYVKHGDTDVSVECGDYARILNDTKFPGWIYVLTENDEKGFIPRSCAIYHTCEGCEKYEKKLGDEIVNNNEPEDKIDREKMTRFAVVENFSCKDNDELQVCVGDFVYKKTDWQSIDGWTWVYSSKLKKWGYVPVNILKEAKEVCPV